MTITVTITAQEKQQQVMAVVQQASRLQGIVRLQVLT